MASASGQLKLPREADNPDPRLRLSPIIGRPVPDHVLESIRAGFTLPTEQVRRRLAELVEDTDPVMRQLVSVVLSGLMRIGGCHCQGNGSLTPRDTRLFRTDGSAFR